MLLFTSEMAFHWTWMEKVGLHWYCCEKGVVIVISWGDPWYCTLASQSGKCCVTFRERVWILKPERCRSALFAKLKDCRRSVIGLTHGNGDHPGMYR